jgi:hypothetical protein
MTDMLKNMRQIHYVGGKSPTRGALTNLQAIAYAGKGFVHFIATCPELIAVVGMEENVNALNDRLQINDENEVTDL